MTKKWIILIAVCAFCLLAFALSVCRIPPDAMTRTNMTGINERFLKYYSKIGKVPSRLEELPLREGYDNSLMDGWGRPIGYRVEGDRVILESLGRDGLPGGGGQDRDIRMVFKASDSTPASTEFSTLGDSP